MLDPDRVPDESGGEVDGAPPASSESSARDAELVFGAKASHVGVIGWTKITAGLVGLIAGGLAAFVALRRRDREMPPPSVLSPDGRSGSSTDSPAKPAAV